MAAVRITESGGEQSRDRLPDDLITAIAEDSLGPFVEEGDSLRLIDADDCVG